MKLIICLIGSCVGLYIGIWKMLISSIITACTMFDAGTLTGFVIGFTIFKCVLALPVTEFVCVAVSGILLTIYYIIKGELF